MSKPLRSAKADPDLVDRIITMLGEMQPEWLRDQKVRQEVESALRSELGGQRHYVAARPPSANLAREVLMRFSGRNVSEVARQLGIGRATVYRVIRQAGRAKG